MFRRRCSDPAPYRLSSIGDSMMLKTAWWPAPRASNTEARSAVPGATNGPADLASQDVPRWPD